MGIALAEALLRRTQLREKVAQLHPVKMGNVYDVKAKRVKVTESIDDLTLDVPLLSASQVTSEYDFYANQLRRLDAIIQRANWETVVSADDLMSDYDPATNPHWDAKKRCLRRG